MLGAIEALGGLDQDVVYHRSLHRRGSLDAQGLLSQRVIWRR
jgi:hypothetical protein